MDKLKQIEKLVDAEIALQMAELEKSGQIKTLVKQLVDSQVANIRLNYDMQDQIRDIVSTAAEKYLEKEFKLPQKIGDSLVKEAAETIQNAVCENLFDEDYSSKDITRLGKILRSQLENSK